MTRSASICKVLQFALNQGCHASRIYPSNRTHTWSDNSPERVSNWQLALWDSCLWHRDLSTQSFDLIPSKCCPICFSCDMLYIRLRHRTSMLSRGRTLTWQVHRAPGRNVWIYLQTLPYRNKCGLLTEKLDRLLEVQAVSKWNFTLTLIVSGSASHTWTAIEYSM